MPEPNLHHAVEITLIQRDMPNTVYDPDTREPVRQLARKTEVTINAQILWEFGDVGEATGRGLELGERGYFTVKTRDMRTAGVSIKFGDRVVLPGPIDPAETLTAYVTRVRPMGHYPTLGATILRAYFADRSPAQSSDSP